MITQEMILKRLQEEIRRSGLTQSEIAEKMAIAKQTLRNYVKGRRIPPFDVFANLCVVIDADANYILCLE